MVRFIIKQQEIIDSLTSRFTFQYGQIYYPQKQACFILLSFIYIPIWLDLLFSSCDFFQLPIPHLHSNMVRFIIHPKYYRLANQPQFTFQYGQIYYEYSPDVERPHYHIYIPIWLDLLLTLPLSISFYNNHLHSNMVRFIIYRL